MEEGVDSAEPQSYLLLSAMGVPRLWNSVITAAKDGALGYQIGIKQKRNRVDGHGLCVSIKDALIKAAEHWQKESEWELGVAFLQKDEGHMHVFTAGPCRIYLHRGQATTRLSQGGEDAVGILQTRDMRRTMEVHPGDWFIVGSQSAFSQEGIVQAKKYLENEVKPSHERYADSVLRELVRPAQEVGIGALASMVLI